MEKELKVLTAVLRSKSVNEELIKEKSKKIEGNIPPLKLYEMILTLLRNKNGRKLSNVKTLIDVLSINLKNIDKNKDTLFIAASKFKEWLDIYDLFLGNGLTPDSRIDMERRTYNLFEYLLSEKEYDKLYYLKDRGVKPVILKFNNIVDDCIKEIDFESVRVAIDIGLWETKNNIYSFSELDKDVLNKDYKNKSVLLLKMIDYLDQKNLLDERDKKKICLGIVSNEFLPIEFCSEVFKKIPPDFKTETLMNISEVNNIYYELSKDNFKKLFLCEDYHLNLKHISVLALLHDSIDNGNSLRKTEEIYNRVSDELSKGAILYLVKKSFREKKFDEAFFYISRSEKDEEFYYAYRETLINLSKDKVNIFLKNMDTYLPEFMDIKGKFDKEQLTCLSLAFCFNVEMFNHYFLSNKLSSSIYSVIYNPLKAGLITIEEMGDNLKESALSLSEKNDVINYLKKELKGKSWDDIHHEVIADMEKKLLKREIGIISDESPQKIKRL